MKRLTVFVIAAAHGFPIDADHLADDLFVHLPCPFGETFFESLRVDLSPHSCEGCCRWDAMFQHQSHAFPQPAFSVTAKILDFVPAVAIGNDTGDGQRDDLEKCRTWACRQISVKLLKLSFIMSFTSVVFSTEQAENPLSNGFEIIEVIW